MKKTLIIILLIVILIAAVGCGDESVAMSDVDQLIIIGSQTKNMAQIDLNGETIQNALHQLSYEGGTLWAISADGSPSVTLQIEVPGHQGENLSLSKKDQLAKDYASQLTIALPEALIPTVPEVQVLEGMSLAGRIANGEPTDVLVLINGLSTTGVIDFSSSDTVFLSDPIALVDQLEMQNQLPNLKGCRVTYMYIGDVSGDQAPLSKAEIEFLKAFWEELAKRSGADEVIISTELPAASPRDVYIKVPDVSSVTVGEGEAELVFESIVLDSEQLSFIGDSDRYIDEALAHQVLEEAANVIVNSHQNIYIVGTTAGSGTGADSKALALARASSVKEDLIEYGVAEGQITAVCSLPGEASPWYEDDIEDGKLVEDIAKGNRTVRIIFEGSPDYHLLMGAMV